MDFEKVCFCLFQIITCNLQIHSNENKMCRLIYFDSFISRLDTINRVLNNADDNSRIELN